MGLQLQSVGKNKHDSIILKSELPSAKIWPIAGGKGGTGKSTLTANVGIEWMVKIRSRVNIALY